MKNLDLTKEELQLVKNARAKAHAKKNKEKIATQEAKAKEEANIKEFQEKRIEEIRKANIYVNGFFTRENLATKGFELKTYKRKQNNDGSYYATYGPEYNAMLKRTKGKKFQDLMKQVDDGKINRWDLPHKYRDLVYFVEDNRVDVEIKSEFTYEEVRIVSTKRVDVVKNYYEDGKSWTKTIKSPMYAMYYNTESTGSSWRRTEKEGISVNVADFKTADGDYQRYDRYFVKGSYGSKYVYNNAKAILKHMADIDYRVESKRLYAIQAQEEQKQLEIDHAFTCKAMDELLAHKNVAKQTRDMDLGEYHYELANGLRVDLHLISKTGHNGSPKKFIINYDSVTLPMINERKFSQEQFDMFLMFCEEFEFGKTATKKAK